MEVNNICFGWFHGIFINVCIPPINMVRGGIDGDKRKNLNDPMEPAEIKVIPNGSCQIFWGHPYFWGNNVSNDQTKYSTNGLNT